MKLQNRDANVEKNAAKRAAVKNQQKSESPPIKREKTDDPPKFDYDANNLKDPHAVANFAPDIFQYMQSQEKVYQLPKHGNIKEEKRALIVDWLVEIKLEFQYTHETLYTAVRLFDIYMAGHPSTKDKQLQLIAASSFLIASKFEEYQPARMSDLGKLCQKQYGKEEFLAMEREILVAVRCDLGFPLAYSFLRRFSRVVGTNMKTLTLARFYLEITTHYLEWSLELPSKVAAISLMLALEKTKSELDWAPILEQYSNYVMADLAESMKKLDNSISCFKKSFPNCKTVISKYSDETFFCVAKEYLD